MCLLAFAIASAAVVSGTESVSAADPPLPICHYTDRPARYAGLADYYRTLVDTDFRLPTTYAPRDLVPVSRSGAPGAGSVRTIVMADMKAMFAAAKAAGAPFAVESAYRSYSYQVGTFQGWVRRAGVDRARLASARPGHSEHQLGTSMDLTSPASFVAGRVRGVGRAPWLYPDWGTTKAGAWLARNAWRYGFLLSYPKVGSPQKTCYKYEPWHFRYFGRSLAAKIKQSGLTPREWLWRAGAAATWTGAAGTGSPGAAPPIDGVSPDPPSTDTVAGGSNPVIDAGIGMTPLGVGFASFFLMLVVLARRGPRVARRDGARTRTGDRSTL